jgi:GNAT superfamily N-acetyltransferase
MECAIRRPWRIGERERDVLEVFDWYVLPELRRSGVGVRVMQALMREPHPLMLVGGTEDTQALLPRLGWQCVATSTRWLLPLGTGRLLSALARRVRIPAAAEPAARALLWAALHRPGHRPRPRAVPAGGRAIAVAAVGDEIPALLRSRSGPGSWPLWTDAMLRWLTAGFPGVGHFLPLYFSIRERLVGFALVRVYEGAAGAAAEIVELFAAEPSEELYTWMVSEAATRAAGFGVELVATSTTLPAVEAALRRNHFVHGSNAPVHFFLRPGEELSTPLAIGSNTGDTAILDFVERWWGDPG